MLHAEAVLTPVFVELCFNLESFNPAFTSCLLMVGGLLSARPWPRITKSGRRTCAPAPLSQCATAPLSSLDVHHCILPVSIHPVGSAHHRDQRLRAPRPGAEEPDPALGRGVRHAQRLAAA